MIKKIVVVLIIMLVFVGFIFAQNFRTGQYSPTDGTRIILRFHHGSTVQVSPSEDPHTVLGRGYYTINGNRLTINFGQVQNSFIGNSERDFTYLSGRTFVYSIQDDSFIGNGEEWVRIGN